MELERRVEKCVVVESPPNERQIGQWRFAIAFAATWRVEKDTAEDRASSEL